MGYGLPAAVAAKLAEPEKTVLAFAGDGCFQMTMQEFGTAVEFGAAVIVHVRYYQNAPGTEFPGANLCD